MIRPILFNTEMITAILDDRKTVTRRMAKFLENRNPAWTGYIKDGLMLYNGSNEPCCKESPYQPGDILYVRETWQYVFETEYDSDAEGCCVNIRSLIKNFDNIPKTEAGISTECSSPLMKPRMKYYVYKASDIQYADGYDGLRWRPCIHMPKEAARIFLRVTDVRMERLNDMTLDDFLAEGVVLRPEAFNDPENAYMQGKKIFIHIWNSTIKKEQHDLYGWDANPWVWVIEFERCERPEGWCA